MESNPYEKGSIYFVSVMGICFLIINTVGFTVLFPDYSFWDRFLWAESAVPFTIYTFNFLLLLFLFAFISIGLADVSDNLKRLKVVVWAIAATLSFLSAARASIFLPLALSCLIWAVASCISVFSLYFVFFIADRGNKVITEEALLTGEV